MKIRFFILLLIIFGCETKNKKSVSEKIETKKLTSQKIEIENNKYFVGDINKDKVNDTAFINVKRNIGTNEIECGNKNCFINIKFSKNIPEISFEQSLGVFVAKTEDLNKDNANEIITFSRTYEGWWNNISVWTLKNGKWNEIGKTKGYISENKDFENRIVKENNKYYLIGENQFKENEKGEFIEMKIKI